MVKTQQAASGTAKHITRSILLLRGQRVLLDAELATLYGVATKVLLQAVKRNSARFPEDFMIQLTTAEWAALRSQIVTLEPGRGQHRKYLPYAFTEQGVAMLSSVLNSRRAEVLARVSDAASHLRRPRLLPHRPELPARRRSLSRRLLRVESACRPRYAGG